MKVAKRAPRKKTLRFILSESAHNEIKKKIEIMRNNIPYCKALSRAELVEVALKKGLESIESKVYNDTKNIPEAISNLYNAAITKDIAEFAMLQVKTVGYLDFILKIMLSKTNFADIIKAMSAVDQEAYKEAKEFIKNWELNK